MKAPIPATVTAAVSAPDAAGLAALDPVLRAAPEAVAPQTSQGDPPAVSTHGTARDHVPLQRDRSAMKIAEDLIRNAMYLVCSSGV